MRTWKVQVILPRFKITADFRLEPPLQALGMKLAFSAGADFSGMIKGGGAVGAVVHGAHVDVNERGTVAAAFTFGIQLVSAPRTFHADHPFVFFIRENGTGSLLFAGRLANPLAG
jgi:serpin B